MTFDGCARRLSSGQFVSIELRHKLALVLVLIMCYWSTRHATTAQWENWAKLFNIWRPEYSLALFIPFCILSLFHQVSSASLSQNNYLVFHPLFCFTNNFRRFYLVYLLLYPPLDGYVCGCMCKRARMCVCVWVWARGCSRVCFLLRLPFPLFNQRNLESQLCCLRYIYLFRGSNEQFLLSCFPLVNQQNCSF